MARITFVELPVDDVAEASAFYREAFAMEMTAFGPSYACTMTGRTDLGLQGDAEEQAAAPLPVITVDDLDVAETAVAAAGGTITRAAFSFPGGRRFHFRDPSGNELAVAIEVAD
jgi:predicted enzyme related to lactoylglutathione lyase